MKYILLLCLFVGVVYSMALVPNSAPIVMRAMLQPKAAQGELSLKWWDKKHDYLEVDCNRQELIFAKVSNEIFIWIIVANPKY